MEIISSFGYKVFKLEKMPVEEQIDLFYNAEKAIGNHGAGLTNIIYRCGAKLELIELFPPNNIPPTIIGYHLC